MKKKFLVLLLALTTALLLSSIALADGMVTECPFCGNTAIGWFKLFAEDGATDIHHQYCPDCVALVGSYELCTPTAGTATCATPECCSTCGGYLWGTGTYDPTTHYALIDWEYYNAEMHYRYCPYCGDASSFEYQSHSGDPSCTALGECTICAGIYAPMLVHWYLDWSPNGDDTHTAACRRDGCGHTATVTCEPLPFTINGVACTVCPVCGSCDQEDFLRLADASILAADSGALPANGEPLVRGLEAPADGVLYALTACWEQGGQTAPFLGAVTVQLPLTLPENIQLIRIEGETCTEIPFTLADGVLSFEIDAPGVFLITSK